LQRHNGNNSGNSNENAIAIGVWDVCLDVPERIKKSAIVDKKQLDLCSWIFHEFRKMQYFKYIVSFAV
jgi:hypothetical protein